MKVTSSSMAHFCASPFWRLFSNSTTRKHMRFCTFFARTFQRGCSKNEQLDKRPKYHTNKKKEKWENSVGQRVFHNFHFCELESLLFLETSLWNYDCVIKTFLVYFEVLVQNLKKSSYRLQNVLKKFRHTQRWKFPNPTYLI